eukprot:6103681-Prymnesium_polylepis.1
MAGFLLGRQSAKAAVRGCGAVLTRASAPAVTLVRHTRNLCTPPSVCVPPAGLLTLRLALDDVVLGQPELKEALILALIASEHLYVEGPPGAAKTLLAESAANLAGLR